MEPTATGWAAYSEIELALENYFWTDMPGSNTLRGLISHAIREWPGEGKRRFAIHLPTGEIIEVTLEQVK